MQVTVTFRHIEPTEPLRQYAADKLQRLSKYLHRPMGAHVILSVLKKNHRAEINLSANGTSLFSEEVTNDLYSAIDLALDKIERQVKKLNAKRKNHQAEHFSIETMNREDRNSFRTTHKFIKTFMTTLLRPLR